jgi:hypothetical protein
MLLKLQLRPHTLMRLDPVIGRRPGRRAAYSRAIRCLDFVDWDMPGREPVGANVPDFHQAAFLQISERG